MRKRLPGMALPVLFLLLLLLLPSDCAGETLHVAPGGLGEALSSCRDGDVLELADGIYGTDTEEFPLTVSRAVTLRAAEGAAPVIDAPRGKDALRIEADGVTLLGLEIMFRRTGVYAVGNNLTMENCRIILPEDARRVSACGMWCGGIRCLTMRGCAFTRCGISLAGPPLSERSENLPKLTGLFEVGEDPEFFTSHTVENCTVNGRPLFYAAGLEEVSPPADAGEIICCGCGSVTVLGADTHDASMGIILAYDESVLVKDSRADRCGVFGIYVAKCTGAQVIGCSATETNHGIDIRGCDSVLLRDCTAADCEQGLFFSSVSNSTMEACTVTGTRQGYFMAGGSGNRMIGCLASGSENGIHLENCARVEVTGCTVEQCTVCGVRLDRAPVTFSGNTLRGNWVGIIAYGQGALDAADNLFENNLNCGMYLNGISFSRITGNRFTGSGEFSVIAKGATGGSVFSGNETDVPPDFSAVTEPFTEE